MKKISLAIMLTFMTAQVNGLEFADASYLETPKEFWDRMDTEWADRQKADKQRRALDNQIRDQRIRDLERNYDLMRPNNTWNPYQQWRR